MSFPLQTRHAPVAGLFVSKMFTIPFLKKYNDNAANPLPVRICSNCSMAFTNM